MPLIPSDYSVNPITGCSCRKVRATSIFFGLFSLVITAYFMWWGLDYTNYRQPSLFLFATVFGLFMSFSIGGNDVANSFGTSVGAGTLSISQALAVAAIFEVSGAVIAGGEVTNTIRKEIVDLSNLAVSSKQYIYVMLSALIAAALWLLFATKKGLPVSTTHSIIGGVVGSSIVMGMQVGGMQLAFATVYWQQAGHIALSWVLSPLLGGLIAYGLYKQIKVHILVYNDRAEQRLKELKVAKKALKKRHKQWFGQLAESLQLSYNSKMIRDQDIYRDDETERKDLETDYYQSLSDIEREKRQLDTFRALRICVPLIAAFGAVVMSAMVVFIGLKNVNTNLSTLDSCLIITMIGAIVWLTTSIYTKSIKGKRKKDLTRATFLLFSWMQVFTAAGFAFSHGANDIANAVAPFVAIMDVIRTNENAKQAAIPSPVLITFGVALVVGLWFIGKEVIQTVGTNLAKMHPASGFAVELSAASVVMGASMLGLPISSTHVLVGAVIGIGMVNKDTNWSLMKLIGLAWIITLPAAAILSMLSYLLLATYY